ncbi:hypothetical protein Q4491_08965 [Photobacterium sp. 2_MG-2023]|uniref:Uncharacterized protein n=1 Tax=Photobacterium arenosum TaxID=2774143 RepID=A0ABR9BGW1_9GAMM|nr:MULTISPECIES: hypothetical protein [Photobacterium]MBD8511677.1 hypothetical protein [Photobacterium arenosum]MBV7264011.1 hypothetical protein [Photobacterium sp. WH24]MDO6581479.1 hypothetical protein [Photobacterium sp. 2_MG-2023]
MSDQVLSLVLALNTELPDRDAQINAAVKSAESEFQPLLHQLAWTDDRHMSIVPDSMTIKDIVIAGTKVTVTVDFNWSIFEACLIVDHVSKNEAKLQFELVDDSLVMNQTFPPRWRYDQ